MLSKFIITKQKHSQRGLEPLLNKREARTEPYENSDLSMFTVDNLSELKFYHRLHSDTDSLGTKFSSMH